MKFIPGTDEKYAITIGGVVWRMKGNRNNLGQAPPHIVKDHDNGNGYRYVQISCVPYYVHRLVALTYLPNPANLRYVGHKDHDRTNNHVGNLYWTTASRNTKDGVKDGKINKAGRYGDEGMTLHSDRILCQAYIEIKCGEGITKTSNKHNINRTTLSSWLNKRSRRDLTDLLDVELDEIVRYKQLLIPKKKHKKYVDVCLSRSYTIKHRLQE